MERPKTGWKLRVHSFSYVRIWFKDGNKRTMYSLDWKHRYSQHRERLIGLQRLRKIIHTYGNKADGAVIYDNLSKQPIETYFEGELISK